MMNWIDYAPNVWLFDALTGAAVFFAPLVLVGVVLKATLATGRWALVVGRLYAGRRWDVLAHNVRHGAKTFGVFVAFALAFAGVPVAVFTIGFIGRIT